MLSKWQETSNTSMQEFREGHQVPTRMAITKNKQTTEYQVLVCKEKLEFLRIAGGNGKWCNHYRKQYGSFSKKI